MRDHCDHQLLENRNRLKFGYSVLPSVEWLMNQALEQGENETRQYQNVLNWVLRPDLYRYRRLESGGLEFKRISSMPKRRPGLEKLKIKWLQTDKPEFPLKAQVNNDEWKVRVNDFSEHSLYTLLINSAKIADFDNWPNLGTRRLKLKIGQ